MLCGSATTTHLLHPRLATSAGTAAGRVRPTRALLSKPFTHAAYPGGLKTLGPNPHPHARRLKFACTASGKREVTGLSRVEETAGSADLQPNALTLGALPAFTFAQLSSLAGDSDLAGALVLAMLLLPAEPAHAALIPDDRIPDWGKNVLGFLYLAFFGSFVLRVFKKRAKFATTTKLAGRDKADEERFEDEQKKKPLTLLDAFGGSLVAAVISTAFWGISLKIDEGFAKQSISNTYEIAQITITIRTIVSGLAYLATFVFAANATGLFLLGFQLIFKKLTGQVDEEEEVEAVQEQRKAVEAAMEDKTPTTLENYLANKERIEKESTVGKL